MTFFEALIQTATPIGAALAACVIIILWAYVCSQIKNTVFAVLLYFIPLFIALWIGISLVIMYR